MNEEGTSFYPLKEHDEARQELRKFLVLGRLSQGIKQQIDDVFFLWKSI